MPFERIDEECLLVIVRHAILLHFCPSGHHDPVAATVQATNLHQRESERLHRLEDELRHQREEEERKKAELAERAQTGRTVATACLFLCFLCVKNCVLDETASRPALDKGSGRETAT